MSKHEACGGNSQDAGLLNFEERYVTRRACFIRISNQCDLRDPNRFLCNPFAAVAIRIIGATRHLVTTAGGHFC
jgi:hypothetical protein